MFFAECLDVVVKFEIERSVVSDYGLEINFREFTDV